MLPRDIVIYLVFNLVTLALYGKITEVFFERILLKYHFEGHERLTSFTTISQRKILTIQQFFHNKLYLVVQRFL